MLGLFADQLLAVQNNLVRCSLGAAMVSVIDIIINAIGEGWTVRFETSYERGTCVDSRRSVRGVGWDLRRDRAPHLVGDPDGACMARSAKRARAQAG